MGLLDGLIDPNNAPIDAVPYTPQNYPVSHALAARAQALAHSLWNGFTAPGRAYQGQPMTMQDVMDAAGLMTLGLGAPAQSNALGAGVRTYQRVPDSLMGIRKNGPQAGFAESRYPYTQDVEVTFPAAGGLPQETMRDQIKGMNPDHALERAYRNWPAAKHITPLFDPNKT